MAAVAVLRNDSLQAFLQDRTPSASPDLGKHSPLALLAATCSRIGQPGATAPPDFLQVPYDPALGSPSRLFHPWTADMPAHSPGALPPPHPSLGLTPQKTHLQPSFGAAHELPLTPPADPSYPYEFSPVKMLPSSMAALPASCAPAYVPYAAQAALPPGYSNLLPPPPPPPPPPPTCRQLSPNPAPDDLPWWSIPQAGAGPGASGVPGSGLSGACAGAPHAPRFPAAAAAAAAAAALQRGLVLGPSDFAQYQSQIAALLQTKAPLAATARSVEKGKEKKIVEWQKPQGRGGERPRKIEKRKNQVGQPGKVRNDSLDRPHRELQFKGLPKVRAFSLRRAGILEKNLSLAEQLQ
ncbi:hypothetical protein H8959_022348 [Pygathrix nigripes]